jgi:5-methyltetrahydrofolate--homocysteine methyltransferase
VRRIKSKGDEMDLEALKEAVINGDVKGCNLLTEVAIQAGHAPQKILNEALVPAMQIVGDKFRCNEVYVPEVLVAARAMKKSLALLKPLLTQTGAKPVGIAVIGTVKGDLHDIGKNLVCMMLEGAGFEVVDVGSDVAPAKFVQAVKDAKAQILGISTLLTTTMLGMKDVLRALEQADLRTKVKVMVGGAPVTQSFADEIGADAYGESAAFAVDKAKELLGIR